MAHFARLDDNNIVINVHVVDNVNLLKNGIEDEATGIAYLRQVHGNNTNWVQTSYNNNFRKRYAGIGYSYDKTRDAFILPMPVIEGKTFTLDETTLEWVEVT